jgi:hypothetical protein
MFIWNRKIVSIALIGASLVIPLKAYAVHVKIVSGLVGGQDSNSKKLLSLSPDAASQIASHDLLALLKPTGKFTFDNSRNVEGMTFVTPPYQTFYGRICRQDRVTLRYQFENRYDGTGKWLDFQSQPVGVEAQPTFHIERLPVPGFAPGASYPGTICDSNHPDATATWFSAPNAADAVRAANMFRMAEDEVKAGRLTPRPCDPHHGETCREWMLSLDDPSKINSIGLCASSTSDSACYVISFDDVDITISGTVSKAEPMGITPAAITSVRVDTVETISE